MGGEKGAVPRAMGLESEPQPATVAPVTTRQARYRLLVPGGDHIGLHLVTTGRPYEQDLLGAIRALVSRGDLVVDVGANIGNHTIYLAVVCGAIVHAYEPNPKAIRFLRENVSLNHVEGRVKIYADALSDEPGFGEISNPQHDILGAGTARVLVTEHGKVPISRLDDFRHENVRLLKIDVEGDEPAVLRGGLETLSRFRPVVVAEAHDDSALRSIDSLLAPFGYHRFPISFASTPTWLYLPSRRDLLRLVGTRPVIARALLPRPIRRAFRRFRRGCFRFIRGVASKGRLWVGKS
jgi:FkbM family methyltransferase